MSLTKLCDSAQAGGEFTAATGPYVLLRRSTATRCCACCTRWGCWEEAA